MKKSIKFKVLTANRLRDGEVVFFTAMGDWAVSIDKAVIAKEPEAHKALEARGKDAEANNLVTDAYLIEVEQTSSHIRPLHIREQIRTAGPTVRPDLGKQAAGQIAAFEASGEARI